MVFGGPQIFIQELQNVTPQCSKKIVQPRHHIDGGGGGEEYGGVAVGIPGGGGSGGSISDGGSIGGWCSSSSNDIKDCNLIGRLWSMRVLRY